MSFPSRALRVSAGRVDGREGLASPSTRRLLSSFNSVSCALIFARRLEHARRGLRLHVAGPWAAATGSLESLGSQ